MKRTLGKLIIVFCVSILVGVCLSFWVDAQKWHESYDKCIDLVKLYKHANESLR